jgi:hypothetical protein
MTGKGTVKDLLKLINALKLKDADLERLVGGIQEKYIPKVTEVAETTADATTETTAEGVPEDSEDIEMTYILEDTDESSSIKDIEMTSVSGGEESVDLPVVNKKKSKKRRTSKYSRYVPPKKKSEEFVVSDDSDDFDDPEYKNPKGDDEYYNDKEYSTRSKGDKGLLKVLSDSDN